MKKNIYLTFVFSAQARHRGKLLLMVQQQGRWVHEEVHTRVEKRVFRDPLLIRVFVTRTQINRPTRRAHREHRNRLMGKPWQYTRKRTESLIHSEISELLKSADFSIHKLVSCHCLYYFIINIWYFIITYYCAVYTYTHTYIYMHMYSITILSLFYNLRPRIHF